MGTLIDTGGNYSAAIDPCLADNVTGTSGLLTAMPASGEAVFVLIRSVNCKGKGSYDGGGSEQIASCDASIGLSGNDCP